MAEAIAGRYALGAVLGVGGMARVVEGHDLRLDRPVAIKLLPVVGIDRTGRERFRREARSSAGFIHPNVVSTYDAGEADDYLYIVMELVDGPSLATRLTEGRLGISEALRISDAILAALEAAHRSGIVHRDVKPGNVLLGSAGVVKLADFGIASRLDELSSSLTATGTVLGTPTYLAPEQAAGGRATAASDVYSTGVVLYEMLAGSPPFLGPSPLSTAMSHQLAPIPDLGVARPDTPADVVAVVTRALAKIPAQRFSSAAEMRAALRSRSSTAGTAVYETVPPTAPSASPPGRPAGRGRRRWWWPAAVAALLVVAAVTYALGRDPVDDAAIEPVATGGTALASTTALPTTTVAATAVSAATTPLEPSEPPPAAPQPPATVGELIALLAAAPDLYGERTDSVREQLDKIDGPGRASAQRARKLLDQAAEWVSAGQLDASALPVLEAVVGPIAASEEGATPRGDE